MKRQSLVAKAARKFKVTTDSKHSLPVAPNLLEQDFTADAPNQKWLAISPTVCPEFRASMDAQIEPQVYLKYTGYKAGAKLLWLCWVVTAYEPERQ